MIVIYLYIVVLLYEIYTSTVHLNVAVFSLVLGMRTDHSHDHVLPPTFVKRKVRKHDASDDCASTTSTNAIKSSSKPRRHVQRPVKRLRPKPTRPTTQSGHLDALSRRLTRQTTTETVVAA